MFGLFKRKPQELPKFEEIRTSEFGNKYFGRAKPWDWLNEEMIHVFDPSTAKWITMDPWFQQIYLAAEGKMTLLEFAINIAKMYSKRQGIPEGLDTMLLAYFRQLHNDMKLLKLSLQPFELEKNHKLTMSEYGKLKENN
ncbi:hypothetical protein [Seonamhaeicola marinus]|uniref:Uncharacterized protein n=1 Tax=Seonamhaeicola marinus TaxID=1912246 RepID=A0A5D0HSS7_9FLAO|nr:hypothetical protein [Seonamhaeicola marinus]TYA74030.1 hypothetical protein FUA24_11835 [Seonamhaeicola marinus]